MDHLEAVLGRLGLDKRVELSIPYDGLLSAFAETDLILPPLILAEQQNYLRDGLGVWRATLLSLGETPMAMFADEDEPRGFGCAVWYLVDVFSAAEVLGLVRYLAGRPEVLGLDAEKGDSIRNIEKSHILQSLVGRS